MSSKFGTIFNMKYENIVAGKFISRPNRFIADVYVESGSGMDSAADAIAMESEAVKAHVKNTGRLGELLVPGAKIYLEDHFGHMGSRKMRYSLIAVEKQIELGTLLANIDSQAPNKIVKEAIEEGKLRFFGANSDELTIKPEAVYGDSRLDFKISGKNGSEAHIEVKGVTLESDGIASFPDAPTERGIKHLKELEKAVAEDKEAFVIFVLQMKGMKLFRPNDEKHKAFGDALRHAAANGVRVMAFECDVSKDQIKLSGQVETEL